jgi:acetyl-CoA C-acetyltransferase
VELGEQTLRGTLPAEKYSDCSGKESGAFTEAPLYSYCGCTLQAGLGQNPCRQIVGRALGRSVFTAMTINQMCGSGITAIILASNAIASRKTEIAIACGIESMSGAPFLLSKARFGYRKGNNELIDHIQKDGLEDAYYQQPMVYFAEETAKANNISREEAEEYALLSFSRARHAISNNFLSEEIVPIRKAAGREHEESREEFYAVDECVARVIPKKFTKLRPVVPGGILTPATISPFADGAASLVITSEEMSLKCGAPTLAHIIGYAYSAVDPREFTKAPIPAIQQVCENVGWRLEDVDLFEVNEAFATVPLMVVRHLKIPLERMNVNSGACVYGHPLGCSGARIVVSLLYSMKRLKKKRGVAAVCVGGGEGIAIALELPQ